MSKDIVTRRGLSAFCAACIPRASAIAAAEKRKPERERVSSGFGRAHAIKRHGVRARGAERQSGKLNFAYISMRESGNVKREREVGALS